MLKTYSNLDNFFSIASSHLVTFQQTSIYVQTSDGSSTSFSSSSEIKITIFGGPTFIANKNIISAKLICVFESLSVFPILSIEKSNNEIVDIIDTQNNTNQVQTVGGYTFVTFDISSCFKNHGYVTELFLKSNSSTSIQFFGFSYLDSINSQSSSPIKYIQLTHFENYGKKDDSSFINFDVGSSGVADISLVNGNLIFTSSTLVSNLVKTSLNICLCYNSFRNDYLSTGNGFRMTTDWSFEIIDSNYIELTDFTGQKLLYELIDSSTKAALSISSNNDVYYCFENNSYLEVISINNSYKYHSLDKNVMEFSVNNNRVIISSVTLPSGEELLYTYDSNVATNLVSIETPDDIIEISYSNGLVSELTSTKKYVETILTYSGGYLIKADTYRKKYIPFQYPNMSSTLIRSVQFSYTGSLLTSVSNLLEKRRLLFAYANNKIASVNECPFNDENVNYTPRETLLSYDYNYAKMTTPSEHSVYYFFNNYQKLIHAIDEKGNVLHHSYKANNDEIRQSYLLASTSISSLNLYNLVSNGSFECTPSTYGWNVDFQLTLTCYQSDQSIAGDYCLFVNNTSNASRSIYQNVTTFENGVYIFSGKYKILNSGVSGYQAKLNIQYYELNPRDELVLRNVDLFANLTSNTSWDEFIIDDLTIPENATVKIEFTIPAGGQIYLDDISFSNKKLGFLNFVNNASFESINSVSNKPYIWTLNPSADIDSINSTSLINLPIFSTLLQKKTIRFNASTSLSTRKISQQIYISGSKGEHLTFVAWIKGQINKSEEVKAIIKIHKLNASSSSFEEIKFSPINNLDIWQSINGTFISPFSYDYLTIEIQQFGFHPLYIDAVQLFKSTIGSNYLYTENGQLLSQSSSKTNIDESLDIDDKIGVFSGKNGDYLLYQYDENGKEKHVYDNLGNRLTNDYLNNGVIKTISNGEEEIVIQEESENGLLTQIDEMGYVSKQVFDEFGNLVTYIDNNGNVIRRLFDDNFRVVTIERKNALHNLGKLEATYNNLNKVSGIQVSDGTAYEFIYDEWGRRLSSSINGVTFESLTYNSATTNDKSSVVETIINSDDSYEYSIEYEGDDPEHLLLDNDEIFTFKFDSNSRLIKWIDQINDITGFLNYDFSGLLLSETTTDGFEYRYEYDNLEKTQTKQVSLSNNCVFYNYLRIYEFNDINLSGYAFNLATLTNNDVVLAECGPKGLFGLENVSGSGTIFNDLFLNNKKAISLSGKKPIKYDLTSMNHRAKVSALNGNDVRYDELNTLIISTKKFISGWLFISPSNLSKTIISCFNGTSEKVELKAVNSTQLELTVGNITETISYPDGVYLNWIMITLNLYGPLQHDENYASLYINGVHYKTVNLVYADLHNLNSVIIGGVNTTNDATSMSFTLLSIGQNLLDQDTITRIYRSSARALFNNNQNNRFEGVTFYPEINDTYDLIPLNGSYSSIKGLKPLYVNGNSGFDTSFEWEESGKRQVYASFDESYSLKEGDNSLLVYDFHFDDAFYISFDFKLFSINTNTIRTLFTFANRLNGTEILSLFIENSKIKLTFNNATNILCDAPNNNIWSKISLRYNNSHLYIYNGDLSNALFDESTLLLSSLIRSSFGSSLNATDHLNGYIKNIFYNRTGTIINNPTINEQKCLYKYDSFGRKTNSYIGNFTKTFTYLSPLDEDGLPITNRTSTKLASETDSLNNVIQYQYDYNGNLIYINKNNSETTYEYDLADRLIKSETDTQIKEFSYDANGNILNIKITINQVETNKTFNYDSSHGKRLTSIIDGNNTIIIGYSGINTLYPNRIGEIYLTWEGQLLKEIDNDGTIFEYRYDYQNRRIKKIGANSITNYYYDKDKLVMEKIGSIITSYHYDNNLKPIGFSINNSGTISTYFYLKDEFGVIHGLIDSLNQQIVSYTYDEFGQLISATGNQTLISLNHIIYKGYFYDQETGFYLLGKRYYYPYACRFISPDDVDYLLANLSDYTQFNLFSYCNNNPIMFADESGHFVFLIVTLAALIMPPLLAITAASPTIVFATSSVFATAIAAISAIELFGAVAGISDSVAKGFSDAEFLRNTFDTIFNVYSIVGESTFFGIGLGLSFVINNSNLRKSCLSFFNNTLPIELRDLVQVHFLGLFFVSSTIHDLLTNFSFVILAFGVNWIFGIVIATIDTSYYLTQMISSNTNYLSNMVEWNAIISNSSFLSTIECGRASPINLLNVIKWIDDSKIWINQQNNYAFYSIKFGFSNINESGCGVIATFNAIQFAKGVNVSDFPEMVLRFEQKNLLFGKIGALPNEMKDYLAEEDINFQTFDNKTSALSFVQGNDGSNAILSVHFNNYFPPSDEISSMKWEDYLGMHYTFNIRNKSDSNYYGLNDEGSFTNEAINNLWDDIDGLVYRGFLYAIIVSKNNGGN